LPNPISEWVNAVDIHFGYIDLNIYDHLQYCHYVLQQHCSLLIIKAIVLHIVYLGHMFDNSCVAELSPYYFAHFGKIYFIKICLCNGIMLVSDIVSMLWPII